MYNKEYMGLTKDLYIELENKKHEAKYILNRLIETYGAEKALEFMQKLEKEKLNE